MGQLIVQDKVAGDVRSQWDPAVPAEVESARAQFNSLRAKGYLAYRVEGPRGERGRQLHDFDPEAGMVILAPPLRGG